MNARRTGATAILLILFTGLGIALGMYAQLQRTVALEGNQLYTEDAVLVQAAPADVVTLLSSAGADARIYRSVAENPQARVMLQFGSVSGRLPIHDGRQFSDADTRAAMVGADVPVKKAGNKSFYPLNGIDYPVVARLGLRSGSLLSGDVLIRDSNYFAQGGRQAVVVDGPQAVKAITETLGPQAFERLSSDTLRRTNIDFVSPVLLGFGWALVILGCLTTALLAARYVQPRNIVEYQLGHSRRRILARRSGRQVLVVTMAVAPVIGLGLASEYPVQATGIAAGLSLLGLTTFTALTAQKIWSRHSWM